MHRTKNYIKAYTSLFLVLLLVFSTRITVNAEDVDYLSVWEANDESNYQKVILDEAGLMTDHVNDYEELLQQMDIISQYGHIAVITTDYNSTSAAKYCKNTYRDWFGKESGAVFLIDLYNRELYIFSDGKMNKTINRAAELTITDNVYRYASDGDYYTCSVEALKQIATMLEGGKIAAPMRITSAAFLALMLALMITFILAKISNTSSLKDEKELLETLSKSQSFKNVDKKIVLRTYSSESSDGGGSGGGSGGGGGGGSGSGGGHGF